MALTWVIRDACLAKDWLSAIPGQAGRIADVFIGRGKGIVWRTSHASMPATSSITVITVIGKAAAKGRHNPPLHYQTAPCPLEGSHSIHMDTYMTVGVCSPKMGVIRT